MCFLVWGEPRLGECGEGRFGDTGGVEALRRDERRDDVDVFIVEWGGREVKG